MIATPLGMPTIEFPSTHSLSEDSTAASKSVGSKPVPTTSLTVDPVSVASALYPLYEIMPLFADIPQALTQSMVTKPAPA